MIKNDTTHNIPDIYKEDRLHITSLTETFDNYRYELDYTDLGDTSVTYSMMNWVKKEDGKTAEFDFSNLRGFNEIGMNDLHHTFIQFRVTDQFLGDKVGFSEEKFNEIYENIPCVANAKGYHLYTRNDKNWKDNETYNHRTKEYEDESGALGVDFKLADSRKVSGIIFEDTKVEQLSGEPENSRKNERIGNGFKDDNEKEIKDVVVTLIDSITGVDQETGQIAKVYNGDLIPGEDGKWTAVANDAIVRSGEDGKYEISDIVPGKYYLQFTYGNGETEYTDIDGNKISIETTINGEDNPINSNLYKSTIITGPASPVSSVDEREWFLDNSKQGIYSIAADTRDIIKSRIDYKNEETEINNDYINKNINNKPISAYSPDMDIQFELINQKEIDIYDRQIEDILPKNCSGMNFGIIERPHVNIELEKTIKNIKLTLQNGTTIINGDPKDQTVSKNISSINDANAKLELDASYIYGSSAVVTYSLCAHNRSEIDYADDDYYRTGRRGYKPVSTTVTKIVDYLNNQNASYLNQGENVNSVKLNNEELKLYFDESVIQANKNYKQMIFSADDIELMPECYAPELSKTADYEFTINNLLSTSDGILGWQSYSEILGIKNITLTPQSVSKSGNYIVGNLDTKEADTANATISIYTSTGENKNIIIYYISGAALIIVACGLILIKKFVIKNK